ncbi:MAG: HAMP domain-containing histidine kinase [Colwellia sp.]|nr:HAMP domain-containing histidine kinase [Colwellia sp.]
MNSINKFTSSRRLLLTSILVVAVLLLLTISFSAVFIAQDHEKLQLEQNTTAWANSLAQLSAPYLIENSKDGHKKLQAQFEQLITAPYINYIHVYASQKDAPASFYAEFNKSVYFPAIPDKINEIDKLSKIIQHKNHLELIVNIAHNNQVIGYLYIQSSLKGMNNYIDRITYIASLFFILGVVVFIYLAFSLQRRINQPIASMVESIQQISQEKNYSRRLDKQPLIELDILAKNINILLNRTQKHIVKQDEKYQQALLDNTNLTNKVTVRTSALKESNQELLSTLEKLHQFQGQLVENEKMASLGDMVAGIAHEANTPIGLGVTASSLMTDKHSEIKQAFEDKTLKSSQLKKFLIQGQENLGIISRNLARAAKLISSFKKVAVDQSSADIRQFNVKELLEEVILTLKVKLNEKQVKVTIDCEEQLMVESKPGPINQIFINLIINSLIHGFEHQSSGHINISIMYLSQQLHLNYQDDGSGIDESVKSRVFEPFTTTKRGSGGSGLGLHLVYNLVTQALNGHIDFESNQGKGTKFEVVIPVTLISTQ